ncbi:MAG: serine hydrolase [Gemmatimonadales bacterium]|nr:serine hydrolase [Gemmatimonadales bacterium]
MRVRTVGSCAALVLLVTAVQAISAQRDTALQRRLDAYVKPYTAARLFSGVVLIAKGDTLLAHVAVGRRDPAGRVAPTLVTPFHIASLSKAFTAALVVKLAQEGHLSFDDTLAKFVPGIPNGERITIDQLLRHTAGIGEFDTSRPYLEALPLDQLVALIAKVPAGFPPGSNDQYSNEGYILLARIVERASGLSYGEYLRRVFLAPLALRSTAIAAIAAIQPRPGAAHGGKAVMGGAPVSVPRHEAPLLGASGLSSTATDLWGWMRGVRSRRIVDYTALRYPYGWGRRNYLGHPLMEQSGSVEGFGSYMASYEDGYYAVVLSNVQSGMMGRWGPDLAAVLFGGEISTPPPVEAVRLPQSLAELAGSYKSPDIGNPLIMERRGDRLWLTWGSFPFWQPLSPIGRDRFFSLSDYSVFSFLRDGAGRVTGLKMGQIDGTEAQTVSFVRQ